MNAIDLQAASDRPKPFLSILIPVFDVEYYLAECIDSIFDQKPDFAIEVILLDDCSTDGSRAVIDRLRMRYPDRIALLEHAENRGLSAARNMLLDAAQGDYIWFLDSDDTLLAPALDTFQAVATQFSPDILICDFCRADGQRVTSFEGPSSQLVEDCEILIRGAFAVRKMHSWSHIARRSLWGTDLRFPEGKRFEDIATTPDLMLRARSFYHAPQSLIFYRHRPQSITMQLMQSADFDIEGGDDFAGALAGFPDRLTAHLGKVSTETEFAIAHFQAKNFRQICFRILIIWGRRGRFTEMRRLFGHYRKLAESGTPWSFDRLLGEYRRRREYRNHAFLKLFLILGSAPALQED